MDQNKKISTKCLHNQQIKLFCMKPDCEYPLAGGCLQCFANQHKHQQKAEFIEVQQVIKLMSRYSFPNKVKPQCVALQESFFAYFKRVTSQLAKIIQTINEICKNVVNTIGFPYVSYKNNFNAYRRIKNKQYNSISPSQFQKLINQTRSTPLLKLAETEQKLYLKQVNNSHQMIKQIDHLLASFENLTNYYQQKVKFVHDNTQYQENKKIVERIRQSLKNNSNNTSITLKKPSNNDSQLLTQRPKRINTQKSESTSKMTVSGIYIKPNPLQGQAANGDLKRSTPRPSISGLKSDGNRSKLINALKTEQSQRQGNVKQLDVQKSILKQKERQRRASIDAHLVKNRERKFQQKISQLRKTGQAQQQQKLDIQPQQFIQQKSKQGINNYNLPAQQEKIKVEKPIGDVQIVPVTRKLSQKLYENQIEQVESPLIRNKFKANSKKSSEQKQGIKNSNNGEEADLKNLKNKKINSDIQVKSCEPNPPELSQLSESQQKSFLLLTASLKLQGSKAIPLLQKSIKQCSNNLSAVQYLSFLYLDLNEYQKCLYLCEKYLYIIKNNKSLQKSRSLLTCNKASALNNLGRYSETVKLLENYPSSNQIIIKNLANAYYGLGFLDQAIQYYQKLLSQGNDQEVLFNLSGCLYLIKKYEQAKTIIQSALAFNPLKQQYLQLQSYIKNSIKLNSQKKNL